MKISISNWSFILSIFISIGIPLYSLIYILLKKKRYIKSYFMGVLVFVVSQIILRLPIIQVVLPKFDWYGNMQIFYPVVYIIFLSFTAGIFEEIGRFIGFKGLKKNRTWQDGIAFGLGHGGIEAMLIVGLTNIGNMSIVNAINNGTFDSTKLGISESQVLNAFKGITNLDIVLGGVERISAMILHVFLTMIVLYVIKERKKVYLLVSIVLHGLVNFIVVSLANNGVSNLIIELGFFMLAVVMLIMIIKSKKIFEKLDSSYINTGV